MRTVYVTGGYSDTLELDARGADFTGATFKVALVPEASDTEVPPPVDDPRFLTATVVGSVAGALKRAVPTTQAVGRYYVWLQIALGGIVVPVLVRDDRGQPWLVRVV